jgi:putative transposase
VKANQAQLPVRSQCETLQVSTRGYYDWLGRAPSKRAQANATLLQSIRWAHLASDETYGMLRIRAELADMGIKASRKRIARLMRVNHLHGVSRRRGWCVTTTRNLRLRPAPDLVDRKFVANDINVSTSSCPQASPMDNPAMVIINQDPEKTRV